MTREIIALALEAEGLKVGAQGVAVPDEREGTFFVGAPGDIMHVSKVVKLELREKYVALQTAKDERYFFAYEDVLGFRLAGVASAKERSAGFSR
jgi:hypothetical protein